MQCVEVQKLLNEEPQPGSVQLPEVEAHLEQCPDCRSIRQELVGLRAVLRTLQPAALPEGFDLKLRRRLVAESKQQQRVGKKASSRWSLSRREKLMALAASVLLVLSGVVIWRALVPGSVQEEPVSYHRLHLAISAVQAHEGALFDIALPGGVELVPEAGAALRAAGTLRWKSDLLPGRNEIDLPLMVRGGVTGPIHARLTVEGRTFSSEVALEARGGRASLRAPGKVGVKVVEVAWLIDEQHASDSSRGVVR